MHLQRRGGFGEREKGVGHGLRWSDGLYVPKVGFWIESGLEDDGMVARRDTCVGSKASNSPDVSCDTETARRVLTTRVRLILWDLNSGYPLLRALACV